MTDPVQPRSRRRNGAPCSGGRSTHLLRVCLALGGALLALGCHGLARVDRKIEREVAARAGELSGDAAAPRYRAAGVGGTDAPGQADKDPRSINPGPRDIRYTGADASRDVLARLDRYAATPENARQMDLSAAFHQAQQSAREYLTAEEEYILAVIRLLIERHLWGPRFFDELTVAYDAPSDDGDYNTALSVINELRVTQRLPYGGAVEARLITEAVQQLTNVVGDQYTQASQLVLSAEIPFLRNAGLIAQEDLIQAEREVVYAARSFEDFRRGFLVDIARDFFSLLALKAVIKNQEERLRSVTSFRERTEALVQAGREPPFEARNVEQNVLVSRNDLANSREAYILALDRFKVRLGLPVDHPILLDESTLDLADPDITTGEAAEIALRLRLDLQNSADRVDDARRGVSNARNQLLPDLNAALRAAFNTDPGDSSAGLSFDLDQTDYLASVTFGLPLDREIERLNVRAAIINLQQQARTLDQARDDVVLEARRAVREIDRSRFSLTLQEQAVTINELRLEEIQIKSDEVDAQTRLDAENELLNARNTRDRAIRDLRIAILEYLRTTGQLRVARDGQFQPLRGMRVAPGATGASGAPPSDETPGPVSAPGVNPPPPVEPGPPSE